MLAEEKLACKQRTLYHAPWSASPAADHKFFASNSWPWQLQEERLSQHSVRSKVAAPAAHEFVSPVTSVTHRYKQQQQPHPYSLSSRPEFSATLSTSRSAISSSPSASTSQYTTLSSQSYATSSPAAPPDRIQQFTSLWDDESDESLSEKDAADQQQQHPPVHPCDYMKTLLTQLGSSISSITTAYAHQQAAVHSHNVQATATDHHGRGNGGAPTRAVISATDKAMVEALESLSRVHSQLALLPRRLPFKESGAEGGAEDMVKEEGEWLQLKRYEGIIARFHDEIWRNDAVVEALKETLAKSMLKGEKLQQRVHTLEAQLSK